MRWIAVGVGVLAIIGGAQRASAYCCQVSCSGQTPWTACSSDGNCPIGPCAAVPPTPASSNATLDPQGTCGTGPSPVFGFDFQQLPSDRSRSMQRSGQQ